MSYAYNHSTFFIVCLVLVKYILSGAGRLVSLMPIEMVFSILSYTLTSFDEERICSCVFGK